MTTLQLLKGVLDEMVEAIRQEQSDKRMRASGNSADSLRVVTTPDGGDIVGSSYFYFQQHGRGPGKFPPIQNIQDWIEARGITPEGITTRSLAYLIARKIATEGSRIHRGEADGMDFTKIVDDGSKKATEELTDFIKGQIIDAFGPLRKTATA